MRHCETCRAPIDLPETITIGGEEFCVASRYCDDCIAADDARARLEARKIAARAEWLAVTPPEYRETDLALLSANLKTVARTWDPTGSRGFGLIGPPRMGKTRAVYAIALKRAAWAGLSIAATTHPQHARDVQTATTGDGGDRARAQARLDKCRAARVLLIDDLGKGAFTARAVIELWELLEYRTSHQRPTLWTANAGSASLLARLAEADQRAADDYGPAILGRLREFSPGVTLEGNRPENDKMTP